jgi:uncharacterized protein (TIGR02466 family)
MLNEYEILELFPIPVYTTILPQELSVVVPWFYKQKIAQDVDSPNFGERSLNSYILEEPDCLDLKNYLLECIKNFGKILGYSYNSYKFGQSWLSLKYPNQHHSYHTHTNSLISGVFYFGEELENTSSIQFYKPGMVSNGLQLRPSIEENSTKYSSFVFNIKTKPGLLILFSSDLPHSVSLNTTNKIRYSLSFNVIPTKGLGEEKDLNELKF